LPPILSDYIPLEFPLPLILSDYTLLEFPLPLILSDCPKWEFRYGEIQLILIIGIFGAVIKISITIKI
jgi:hypothetical protein